jgi:hypothetical protein
MRTHIDTHPDFDFAIGYRAPARKPKVRMCEDCRTRPARKGQTVCYGCGKSRERIAAVCLNTLGAPFVP